MKFRLSLFAKGMILLVVAMTFQLAFMGALGWLYWKAEESAQRAEASKAIVDDINKIERAGIQLYDTVDQSPKAEDQMLRGEFDVKVREQTDEIQECVKDLVDKTHGDPAKSSIVAAAKQSMEQVFSNLHIAQVLYQQGKLKNNDTRREVLKHMRHSFTNITPLIQLGKEEATALHFEGAERAENRQRFQTMLVTMSIVVVAATLILFFGYAVNVVRRINIMVENNIRLATGKKLHPVMSGDDEISTLDRAFHSMAEEIADAVEKERAIAINVNDVIFTLDQRGTFLTVSPASERVFGYFPDELLGNKLINLTEQSAIKDILNALKIIMEGGKEPPFEMLFRRKDGRMIDIVCSAHYSPKEQTVFCVAHDISDRKQAERLRQEVVQMVSHDLKTPLSTVRSFLEMLDAGMFGELSGRGPQLLKLADNSTLRMLTLIKDLLDIEKMEAGMLQLTKKTNNLNELFENAAGGVNSQASEHGVRIVIKPSDLQVFADPDRVVQVLVNLLTNAVKFSPRGQVVTISAQRLDQIVAIKVSDNGRGIPPEKLATIFDRFSQVKASDATEKGGSGLGLAICKALVALHGGSISVASQPEAGSTFIFTLPAFEGALSDQPLQGVQQSRKTGNEKAGNTDTPVPGRPSESAR